MHMCVQDSFEYRLEALDDAYVLALLNGIYYSIITHSVLPVRLTMLTTTLEMKWNEKKLNEKLPVHLNPQYPEIRGAANPSQARYHFPLAVPTRRSSISGHIDDCVDSDFLFSRGIQFQSCGPQPKKPFYPS